MTNGEKIKEVFPNIECEVKDNTVLTNIDNGIWFSLDWWNSEYKEPKCQWIKYDYRTICPKEHIIIGNSPYWRIPDNMNALKYCPYCGKKIEVKL